jgi:hypothetical protein
MPPWRNIDEIIVKSKNELEKNRSGIKPKSKNNCPGIPARN